MADALRVLASLARALADCTRARARTSRYAVHGALNLTWCVSMLQPDWTPATSSMCCTTFVTPHAPRRAPVAGAASWTTRWLIPFSKRRCRSGVPWRRYSGASAGCFVTRWVGRFALRRRGAAACFAVVPHAAWCCRLATPRPSGRVPSGASAPTRRRTEMRFTSIPSRPRTAAFAGRCACSSATPWRRLCRSCCARTSSQHCACRVSAAAVRAHPRQSLAKCLAYRGARGVRGGCARLRTRGRRRLKALRRPCVSPGGDAGWWGRRRGAPWPGAARLCRLQRQNHENTVRAAGAVPRPHTLSAHCRCWYLRMQKPHRWQGVARVRAA